ncbi:MAG: T9SS type A sorting domain-containing protein [Lewinellaceae bacterium]|nr:T9SS type A sorting domain-containing protein [Lewinellaceae bacterium]
MKNRIVALAAMAAWLFLACQAFASDGMLTPVWSADSSANPANENSCPPITNIKVEMLQGGKAVISWDAVPGVANYFVKLTDENLNILLDTVIPTNQVLVSGLTVGTTYKFSVCYKCKKTGKYICGYRTFKYVIIDDQVVMLNGDNDMCSCHPPATTEGICNSSQSLYFTLESSRVYNIQLVDGTHLSFLCNDMVNPLGNCPADFGGMGYDVHGDFSSILPFYEINSSRIYFHGSTFCIQGELVESVTFCGIPQDKSDSNAAHSATGVYPNPFTEMLVVDIGVKGNNQKTTIRLLDAAGRQVLEKNVQNANQAVLHTSDIQPGFFWLVVGAEGEPVEVQRVLKIE